MYSTIIPDPLPEPPIFGRLCVVCNVVRPMTKFAHGSSPCARCRPVRVKAPVVRTRCGRCNRRGHNVRTCPRPSRDEYGPTRKPTGFVYFIRAVEADRVKIGWTVDVAKRLRGLQTSSPFALTLVGALAGETGFEGRLHRRFAADRVSGEWFRLSAEIRKYLASEFGEERVA